MTVSSPSAAAAGGRADRDLAGWRRQLGETMGVWATELSFGGLGWKALSGAGSPDYNLVVCDDGPPGEAVAWALDAVRQAGVPSSIMLAGPTLADAQDLVEAGWVCVGSTPFMALPEVAPVEDARVRRLTLDEYPAARLVHEQTFNQPPELVAVALPDRTAADPASDLWGLVDDGELVSVLVLRQAGSVVAGWSMATPPRNQRKGYGRALLLSALSQRGAGRVPEPPVMLLTASVEGLPFYRRVGFELLEHWQIWSRRRWVIGRS